MKKVIAGFLFGVIVAACGSVAASGSNDHVLHEDQYNEFFKQEGHGKKNYLYTETEFADRWGRKCTVVTGASERTIALDCSDAAR